MSECKLLTIEQVSEMLACSVPTVERLIANRTLKSIKFGRNRRVIPEDLDEFIDSLRQEADQGRETAGSAA